MTKKEQIIEEQVVETSSKKTEDVLTQNTEDAIAIKKQVEAKRKERPLVNIKIRSSDFKILKN